MQLEPRLRAFAALAREGSFSRAAASLYVTQPAVSKHVASLEAELGRQLVVRGRPATMLTPAGQTLADYVLPGILALCLLNSIGMLRDSFPIRRGH